MQTAKLFKNGGSQSVRLPRDFRFAGDAVRIRRDGQRVILEPLDSEADAVLRALNQFSEDFMAGGREQPAMQRRKGSP